jgi:hypothetical protein
MGSHAHNELPYQQRLPGATRGCASLLLTPTISKSVLQCLEVCSSVLVRCYKNDTFVEVEYMVTSGLLKETLFVL